MARKVIIIFSLILFPAVFLSAQDPAAGVFFPDPHVEKLAQKADEKYFRVFLYSLQDLSQGKQNLIKKYFRLPQDSRPACNNPVSGGDEADGITPVYLKGGNSVKGYAVTFPINWSDDINPDPSWRLWFQSLVWLKPYLASNHADSVRAAMRVIDDWIGQHFSYPVNGEKYAFDDHAVAERMVVLTHAFRRLGRLECSDSEFSHRLLISILGHICFVASLEQYSCWHNHAIIFDEKLLEALDSLPEFKKRKDLTTLAYSRIFEQYRYSFTNEGVHKEHSPCYHQGFSGTLKRVTANARLAGVGIPDNIEILLRESEEYSRIIGMAGRVLPIGDCARLPQAVVSGGIRKPPISISEKAGGSRRKLKEKEMVISDKYFSRIYPESGWHYYYDYSRQIAMISQSDFFGYSHYQQDETSFLLNYSNRELITDPGLFSYARSPEYDYYRSPRAHNVLAVEGLNDTVDFDNTGMSGITRFMVDGTNVYEFRGIVEMTHANYAHKGIGVTRQFIYTGGLNFVIRDMVASTDTHTYEQLFHLAPDAIISKADNGFYIRWRSHPAYLLIDGTYDEFRILRGVNDPMQGWIFPAFNSRVEAPVLVLRKRASSCEFKTTITAGYPGSQHYDPVNVKKTAERLIKEFAKYPKRTLTHQPFPEKWTSLRKNKK